MVRSLRFAGIGTLLLVAMTQSRTAFADGESETEVTPAQVNLERDSKGAEVDVSAVPPEAPPPIPYKKTFVLDSSLGAMMFLGQFGNIAPAAPEMRILLGYELLKWLMVFGEGELAFTDTSGAQAPPKTRAFPIYGFDGGARLTIRFTDRLGVYAQGAFGFMRADVPKNGLAILGFGDAENFGLTVGARLGVEWYQIDRHFALGVNSGIRNAQGFSRLGVGGDTPLMVDAAASLRYAF